MNELNIIERQKTEDTQRILLVTKRLTELYTSDAGSVFHVNYEPKGKFLDEETIKLYSTV